MDDVLEDDIEVDDALEDGTVDDGLEDGPVVDDAIADSTVDSAGCAAVGDA